MWFGKKNQDNPTEVVHPAERSQRRDMHSALGIEADTPAVMPTRPSRGQAFPQAANGIAAEVYDDNVQLHDLTVRVRRRLIGVVVVLVAVFLILPWVFDAHRKTSSPSVSVSIPDKNIQFEAKNPQAASSNSDAAVKTVENTATVAALTNSSSTAKKTDKPAVMPPDKLEQSKEVEKPSEKPVKMTKVEEKAAKEKENAAKAKEKAEKAKEAKENAARAKEAKAREAKEKAARAKENMAKAGSRKYAVHIGLVSNQQELDSLLGKLRAVGVDPQLKTVEVGGVKKTRIRLGLFDTQIEAEAAAAKIRSAAKHPVVIPIKQDTAAQ